MQYHIIIYVYCCSDEFSRSAVTHMQLKLEEMFSLASLHPLSDGGSDSGIDVVTDTAERLEASTSDNSPTIPYGPQNDVLIVRNMEEYRELPEPERERFPQSYTASRIRAPAYRQ